MIAGGHSFQGAAPCNCEVCLTVVRLGKTLLLPYLTGENCRVLLEKVRRVLNEAQDIADRDLQAFVVRTPDPAAAPPAGGTKPAPKTPGGGEGRQDRKDREDKERSRRRSPERSRGSKEKPQEERRERSRKRTRKSPTSGTVESPRTRKEERKERSPSPRPRKERKAHRREEDAKGVCELPAEERRKAKAAVEKQPVKEESSSEEGEESSEKEEDPPTEVREASAPGGGARLVPKPPSTPPPASILPGAHYVPWPSQESNNRPPLERWKGPIPAFRPRGQPLHRDRRTGGLKEKPKGKKKKRRQAEIREAGGLENWHATKGGR